MQGANGDVVWMVGGPVVADQGCAQHADLSLAALGDWTGRQYDFHWCIDRVPKALRLYREHPQDTQQYTFQGIVGGMDGSAKERTGCMGADRPSRSVEIRSPS